ncbi:hypothetical protein [Nonomuraea sp. KM90]|uniref:hypothetical protein n=1 Tax=Nonomuraea sp. KM90 TaxID=3457428 RepID=UPI003FCC74BB
MSLRDRRRQDRRCSGRTVCGAVSAVSALGRSPGGTGQWMWAGSHGRALQKGPQGLDRGGVGQQPERFSGQMDPILDGLLEAGQSGACQPYRSGDLLSAS